MRAIVRGEQGIFRFEEMREQHHHRNTGFGDFLVFHDDRLASIDEVLVNPIGNSGEAVQKHFAFGERYPLRIITNPRV